ncbi:MAG: hypothetical protein FWG50_10065, partial [Kiritimatiellaeota bacterium]|nr:hypothetical protein [Kiritimatiellota bacterium]
MDIPKELLGQTLECPVCHGKMNFQVTPVARKRTALGKWLVGVGLVIAVIAYGVVKMGMLSATPSKPQVSD